MKQGIKKALVMLLSVAMVFTMMAMPVYADDFTETETNEVVLGTPETVADPMTEEAEQITETENKVLEEVPVTAAEAVEEEVTEPAAETVELADGTYNAKNLTTGVLSMYHFHDAQVVIKGDSAWLLTTEDYENDSTFDRYDGMAYGKQSEILDETDTTHKTLVEGTVTATVVPVYDEDGTMITRTFVLPVPKSVFEANADIYYMIKYKDGYSEKHDGDWYKASGGDYYLTGYTLEYVSDSTVLPGEETPEETETIALVPTNEELMFKVVNAYIEKTGDKADLVFALSGSGYEDVISGTYDDAMEAQVGASHDNWIHGAKADVNCDYWTDREIDDPPLNHYEEGVQNKWQFRVPVDNLPATGTVKVPIVAVSKSRYTSAEKANPENPDYSAAFTSRQFVIDMDAKTVRTGNLKDTVEVKVASEVKSFAVNEKGTLYTAGTPKANEYTCQPTITMEDLTYDKAFLGTKEEAAAEGAATIAIGEDKSFTLGFFNTLGGKQHIVDGKATAAFHVAANARYAEKDTWVERTFAFDYDNDTITITGDELTAEAVSYAPGEYIVGVGTIKTADGTSYGMFIPNYNGEAGKALITVKEDGTATINYYNTRSTYPKIFLAELDADSLNKVATAEQLADPRCIVAEVYAENSEYREFTYAFDISDLGKTVPFVTLNKKDTFNKSQTAFVFEETMMSKAAFEAVGLIDALPAAADVTVRDKDAIEAARAAYDALTDAQKAEVTNLNKLVAAEEAFAALAGKDEATIAVETAIGTLIQQYTDVNETTAAKVAETRAAYDALSKQQKAYIDDAILFKLYRAEACVEFASDETIRLGAIYDVAVDTSDNSPFIAATMETRQNAAYIYLYGVGGEYTGANLVSSTGKVSRSTQKVFGSVLRGLWMVNTSEGHGRPFVVQLTGPNGNSAEYSVKVPSIYEVMAEGTYEVSAIQTPSSKMRKFERSTVTSDGTEMTVEFVMPNMTYGKIFLGTAEAAAAATEGFIEPTGTEATSGTTGIGNVYRIPLESMYTPIIISYYNAGKDTWTQETVEFVADEKTQAVIDAIAALGLDTYFNVTADQRELVEAANELYKELDENQKAVVENSNYSTLKKVTAMFVIADKTAAQIEALPAADAITADDISRIREVKNAYDNMGKDPELVEALNGNSLQNSQIEKLISKDLRDKLNACLAALADYKAVDAAIAKVPEDLRIYTEETAAAVTAAVDAVDRNKLAAEQAEVDAMAKAIEDAIAALELKPAFDPGKVTRIYGKTRYTTAMLQADELKEILGLDKFSSIIVATGTNYADALAGSYLGYVKNAPILLVRNDVVNDVKNYIKDNLAEGGTVYLLGGETVVPGSVTEGLTGIKVERLSGKDRYQTNIKILDAAGVSADGVIICTGIDFADSLSASAAKLPILLVKGGLNDTQREYLKALGEKKYYLVGGKGVLPVDMETEIAENYGSVTRLGGTNRYETSVKVAEALVADPEMAVVAYAQNYPDGLCGGPLAANLNAPLLLVNDKNIDAAVKYTEKAGIKGGRVLGGPALISDQSARKIFSMKDDDQIIVKK